MFQSVPADLAQAAAAFALGRPHAGERAHSRSTLVAGGGTDRDRRVRRVVAEELCGKRSPARRHAVHGIGRTAGGFPEIIRNRSQLSLE